MSSQNNSHTSSSSSSSSSLCAICWENLDLNAGEYVNNRLPCNHVFHENCIYPWLCQNDTCPLCRYKFPNEKVKWRRTVIPESQLPWMMRSSTIAEAQPQAPVNWWTIRSDEMVLVPWMRISYEMVLVPWMRISYDMVLVPWIRIVDGSWIIDA